MYSMPLNVRHGISGVWVHKRDNIKLQWPYLLAILNFNLGMNKYSHAL